MSEIITLSVIQERCHLQKLKQCDFAKCIFPEEIYKDLDKITKDAGRMSKFFNGKFKSSEGTTEITIIKGIMRKLCDNPLLLNEMIECCNDLAADYPFFNTENTSQLISGCRNMIPSKLYEEIRYFVENGEYGKVLFWLIMISFCREYIEDMESLYSLDSKTSCHIESSAPLTEEDLQQGPPNVYIDRKAKMEDRSIYRQLKGVTELTFINYASTAFITGALVDEKYNSEDERQWFQKHLTGLHAVDITLILTNPESYADVDASRYKMYPKSIPPEIREYFTLSNESYDENDRELRQFIIRKNFNSICDVKLRLKLNNIHIYYTDIALPVGIMKSKYRNSTLNNIQVNMYLPCIGIDDKRPTFVLTEENQETRDLYNIFDDMIRDLVKTPFYGHPDVSFLFRKPIIHRAKLKNSLKEMSRKAIFHCAKKGYPIEVDLLPVAGQFIIGRDDPVSIEDKEILLSRLTETQLRALRKEHTNPGEDKSQIMTLPELLELVQDVAKSQDQDVAKSQNSEPIPLLLELKDRGDHRDKSVRDNVIRICRIMKKYEQETGKKGAYALHSANPLVVRYVKDYDIRIPCGWITLDFSSHEDTYPNLSEDFKELHENAACFGGIAYKAQNAAKAETIYYAIPDFVSCKIGDFVSEDSAIRKKCAKYGIKMLGWAATDQEQYYMAIEQEHYDNVLIENFEP